jgi:hypothetical protein
MVTAQGARQIAEELSQIQGICRYMLMYEVAFKAFTMNKRRERWARLMEDIRDFGPKFRVWGSVIGNEGTLMIAKWMWAGPVARAGVYTNMKTRFHARSDPIFVKPHPALITIMHYYPYAH